MPYVLGLNHPTVTGSLPEFAEPRDVPSCIVAKKVLQRRAADIKLPPNFLDELGESYIAALSYYAKPQNGDVKLRRFMHVSLVLTVQ